MITAIAFIIGGAAGTFVGLLIGNVVFRTKFIETLKSLKTKKDEKGIIK